MGEKHKSGTPSQQNKDKKSNASASKHIKKHIEKINTKINLKILCFKY